MSNGNKKIGFMVLSGAYSTDLRGKQSVRTTFKLTPRCIDALSLLAGQLGIKQKSLFDHLMDDAQALMAIARDLEDESALPSGRVPKTYVISRKTLEILEQVSRKYQTPRDILVEFSIERIMPLIEEEKRKHDRRKKLQADLEQLKTISRKLLEDADESLERDDPVLERIFHMFKAIKGGCSEIDMVISKGERLEDFE